MKRLRDSEDDDDTAGNGEDVAIIPVSKFLNLDTETSNSEPNNAIQCSLPGHARGISFTNYHEYESHYVQVHTNRCLECGKNFPTSHITGLHIQEHHDALAEMKREHGASTYACFVEACEDNFKSHKQRKEHLMKSHAYPRNYFFAVTKFGIDRRQSMLVEHHHREKSQRKESRFPPSDHAVKATGQGCDTDDSEDVPMTNAERPTQRQHEAAQDVPMIETDQSAGMEPTRDLTASEVRKTSDAKPSGKQTKQGSAAVDAEMEDLAGAMSSLKFVPRVIRLGPKQKGCR